MDHEAAREALDALLTGGPPDGDGAGRPAGRRLAELRRHLEQCRECRSWEDDYRLFAGALAAAATHPSSAELARRAAGTPGPAADEAALDEHLEGCAECRRELALTAGALAAARRGDSPEGRPGRRRVFAAALGPPARLAMAAGLILALALAFLFRGAPAVEPGGPQRDPVPDEVRDRVVAAETVSDTRIVEAAGRINAAEVTIEGGGEMVLLAGESVALGNGFAVASGASLKIENPDTGGA